MDEKDYGGYSYSYRSAKLQQNKRKTDMRQTKSAEQSNKKKEKIKKTMYYKLA